MSPRFRFPVWLWLVLLGSTAVSVWVGVERYRAESANRAVHLILDMPDIRTMAGATGRSIDAILAELHESGATAVAIAEETFDDLVTGGKMTIEPGAPVRYVIQDASLEERLRTFALQRLKPSADPAAMIVLPSGDRFPIGTKFGDLRTFGLGFNRAEADRIRNAGLGVVARITNQPLSSRDAIDAVLDEVKAIGAEGILFGGDQVIGRRDLVVYAAEQIRARDMWIGPVEFTTQGGLPRITKELQDRLVRVHSMVAAEIDRNEPPDIIDRYVRAVVERSMKGLFLRPISMSAEDPMREFRWFVSTIRDRLARDGYQAKPARTEMPAPRPLWAAIICGLGVAAAGGFLVYRLAGAKWGYAIGGILILLTAALGVNFGAKYLALAAAMIFPTLAMLAAFDKENEAGTSGKWFAAFFWITALSVIGGLHVAALLTLPSYMLRIEQFFGVKLAHFLPPIVIALYLVFSENNARTLLQGAVRWADVVVGIVILAAVFVMLSRTGNDAPGDVSALELKLRNFLDRVLPERPRTKEFMIGHPALVVSLAMAFKGHRSWLPLTVFLAAIGQVSVLNTFCHIHTPIAVTMLRVVVGFVMGAIVGAFAMWAFNWVARHRAAA